MRSISLFLLMMIGFGADAQETNLSPYSRFGIGDPDRGDFVTQFGMGGSGVALIDGIHINPYNPAAQSFLLSPAFEIGLKTERLQVTSESESSTNSITRFNNFAVGFPMWKGKWGAAFGLKPFTTVGYNNTQDLFSEALDTTYRAEYIGSGGLNQIFVDLSRELTIFKDSSTYKQDNIISLGLRFNYLFGSVNTERSALFPRSSGFNNTRIEDATTMNDVSWTGGFLVRLFTDRKTSDQDRKSSALNIGGSISFEEELRGRRSRNAYTFVENLSGVEFIRDSISSFEGRTGTLIIPGRLSLGLSYELYVLNKSRNRQRKLAVALDYSSADWSVLSEDFGADIAYSGMGNSSTQSIGLSYQPQIGIQKGIRGNLLRLSTYRIGYRTGWSHLSFENEDISESGISFGMSIPLLVKGRKETDTQFDFALAYEERGTTASGLLQEEGLRVMFGFSFHPDYRFDQWFRKRKYD
ncbi:MAG: hypothetical protein HKN45_11010 [Flavobacteriales bacterium]|nr:hypothetical protein [Flavobacteriales bacterium]